MARLRIRPRNTVRFAFWGAEEDGLFGSNFYVNNLTDQQFERIALNLNFDMVGSPNFVRFVYDGDGDAFGNGRACRAPTSSSDVFNRYFRRQRLATDPTAFDGRSDYFAFINVGIPAGGLFSGAEGIKTPAQARNYGGQAGPRLRSLLPPGLRHHLQSQPAGARPVRQGGGACRLPLRHDA